MRVCPLRRTSGAATPAPSRSRAFTLLELIVVLVILGILALLAIPTFADLITSSRGVVLRSDAEAVYAEAEADAGLGITAAPPVTESLTVAAADWDAPALLSAGASGAQAATSAVTVWAQDGTATAPGIIEAYNSWGCLALLVSPDGLPPTTTACNAPQTSLTLMAVPVTATETRQLGPNRTGWLAVAPWVAGARSWTFTDAGGGTTTRYTPCALEAGGPPAEVSMATPARGPVTVSMHNTPTDPGSVVVTMTRRERAVQLTWTLSQATAQSGIRLYRCEGAACVPVATGTLIATLPPSATSFTDTTVKPGRSYAYQAVVLDTDGATLDSPIVRVRITGRS